jgi:hypothetical protein
LQDGPDDALVVVSRGELQRLHETYGTPAPPTGLRSGILTLRQLRSTLQTQPPIVFP